MIKEKTKILFMDDESMIRDLARDYFHSEGYEIEVVKNGMEAVAMHRKSMAGEKPFQVAVLDIMIPGGMGGMETIQNLREIDPSLKGIAISAYADSASVKIYESSFEKFIAKPFTMQQLNMAIGTLIPTESRSHQ